ncbi:MAG: MFS transporter [Acidobacteria bacterium]|nr:MFS transporter [Acidobacteriota bacterium]
MTAAPAGAGRGRLAALSRALPVERGEGAAVLWACSYFFCLLAGYYVIRPLRDEMGVASGGLTWLYMGTLAGTLLANPLFGALVSRYPRRTFIPVVYRFFTINLLLFYLLLGVLPGSGRAWAGRVFFVWTSVFNMFAVAVMWGFMADLFRSGQAKRLFGLIGVGGTLGAIVGGSITVMLAPVLGPLHLLPIAALLIEASVFSVRRLARLFHVDETAQRAAGEGRPPGHGALHGMAVVARSPYLLGICLFLLLYTISSTFLYFEQARIVGSSFADSAQRVAFFARIDVLVNLVTIVLQTVLTGRLVPAIGVGATLAILPLVTLGGLGALGIAAVPGTIMAVQVTRRAAEYALIRPAREVLYTVVPREQKYSSKSFIDTFVYRGGDAIGAWTDKLLGLLGLGAAALAALFVPLTAAWVAVALLLGRRQGALARAAADSRSENARV